MKKIILGVLFSALFLLPVLFVKAETSDKALQADVSIKSNLSGLRAQAELFYDNASISNGGGGYGGSYKYMCKNSSIKEVLNKIKKDSGKTPKCNSAKDNYVISSPLKSDSSIQHCVDSTGFSGSGVAVSKNNTNACEQVLTPTVKLDSKAQKTKIIKTLKDFREDGVISFNDRIQLESDIRSLGDSEIVKQWDIFTGSSDVETANKNGDILISMLSGKKVKTIKKENSKTDTTAKNDVTKKDHFIAGNINSKVKVVTYSSLEDPYSGQFDKTIRELSKIYDVSVAFVFRHNPLSSLFNHANLAANAAECISKVGNEDYFSPYIYAIFKAQEKIANFEITGETLSNLAQDFGVNKNKFDSCLAGFKYNNKIMADLKKIDGTELSSGVPNSIVYGPKNYKQTIAGAQTYDEVKRIIDSLLMK